MVTHQLQVERRTAKAHRPKTNALPLDHATSYSLCLASAMIRLLGSSVTTTDFVNDGTFCCTLHADTGRRSSSTDSRLKRGSDVDVTSRATPDDVIVVTSRGTPRDLATMSSPTSSSMPHLGPGDQPDTIQPLNHIYRSSSAALTGRHDDDEEKTKKRWAGRQGRHGVMTSRDHTVEQCYWSCLSARSNSRQAFTPAFLPAALHATQRAGI